MARNYNISFIVLAFFCISTARGQQLGQYSQYMQNLYTLNPAAAGVNHQVDINMSYRQQWTGINDAPLLYYINGSSPLGKDVKKANIKPASTRISQPTKYQQVEVERKVYHGVGGMVAVHEIAAFKKTLGNLSYAVHVPFTRTLTVGFGTSVGYSSYTFDQSKFQDAYSTDQAFLNFVAGGTQSNFLDISFGMIGYTEKWYISYSAAQLLENTLSLGSSSTSLGSNVDMHHFLVSGYRIPLNATYTLTPSVLVKYVSPAPSTIDATMKLEYQDMIWGAISYRHSSALIGMVGGKINDKFKVGYSYDYAIGGIRGFASGSHEIFLGLMLNKRERASF